MGHDDQRQTGGNLSEILERLAGLIRTRLRLANKCKAWTARTPARLDPGGLPVHHVRHPDGYQSPLCSVLFDHVSLIVSTLGLMALGVLWIRKIVNFEY